MHFLTQFLLTNYSRSKKHKSRDWLLNKKFFKSSVSCWKVAFENFPRNRVVFDSTNQDRRNKSSLILIGQSNAIPFQGVNFETLYCYI